MGRAARGRGGRHPRTERRHRACGAVRPSRGSACRRPERLPGPLAFLPPQVETPASEPGSAEPGAESTGSPEGEVVGAPETPGGQTEAPAGPTGAQADPPGTSAEPVGVLPRRQRPNRSRPPHPLCRSPPAAQPTTGPGAPSADEPPVPATAAAPAVLGHALAAPACRSESPARPRGWQRRARHQPPQCRRLRRSAGSSCRERARVVGRPRTGPAGCGRREATFTSGGTPTVAATGGAHTTAITRAGPLATGDAHAVQAGGSQRALAATAPCPTSCATSRPGGRARAAALRRRRPGGPGAAGSVAAAGPCRSGSAAIFVTRTGQRDVRARAALTRWAWFGRLVRLESPDELARSA